MSEAQPDPARPQSQAAAKPQTRPDAAVPAGADSYTDLPSQPPKRRWGPWAAVALALSLGAGWAVQHYGPAAAPAAAVAEQKVLLIGAKDLDQKGTDAVRAAQTMTVILKDDHPADAKGAAASKAVDLSMPAASKSVPPSAAASESPKPIPIPGLAMPLAPQAVAAVKSGNFALFQLKLVDYADMDGDVVALSVDGVPMGQFTITHGGAVLDVPLQPGKKQVVRITGVYDGGGGITLGVETSEGHVHTRDLAPGESEEWVVDYR